jgi:hypothetical protein
MTAMWCLLQRGRRAQTGLLDVVPGLATREDSGKTANSRFGVLLAFLFTFWGDRPKFPSLLGTARHHSQPTFPSLVWPVR